MEKLTNKSKSKTKVEVPKTDVSKATDVATRNYLIISGAVVFMIALLGIFSIYWLGGKYVNQSNLNKAQDQLISSLVKKQKDLQALKPNFDAINAKGANGISDAELILRAVPTTQDYESLIAILEQMGKESGVKVTNITQQATAQNSQTQQDSQSKANSEVKTAGATPFVFTVNVEGTYTAILDFLKKTENSARVVNFNSMDINGSTGNITANLTMTTYFKPDANIESTFIPLK